MIFRSRSPLRISLAGGGTDVEPYLSEQGGVVLSTTIDRYAYGSLRLQEDQTVTIQSLDYDVIAKYQLDKPLPYDGNLDLVKAVIRRLKSENAMQGFELFLHSDAPPGSGLGSSSTVMVALIGLFKHWLHLPLTQYEIADLAFQIERVDMGIEGGKQDQYAATFGGFNFIEFSGDATVVNTLRLPTEVIHELQHNLLMVYTGKTRLSGNIISTQVDRYRQREGDVMDAMGILKQIASDMKSELLHGQLETFGRLLHEAWVNKKKMADAISDLQIDGLYDAAMEAGALGGKVLGAGGGGHMLFYCPFRKKHLVARTLESLGAEVVRFNFEPDGLQTWSFHSEPSDSDGK